MGAFLGLVLLILLAPGARAAALVIFDTLGPSNQTAAGPGLTIGGGILRGDPPGHAGITVAEEFPPLPAVRLGKIELAVQYFLIAGRATGPASLDISVAADGGGQPGVVLETIHLTNIFNSVANATGIIEADSVLHPLLTGPAPYWLIVAPPDPLNTAFDWKISATGLSIPQATHLGTDPWGTATANGALAFRITSFDGSTAAPTPVPSSWILTVIGLAAAGLYETSRRRSTTAQPFPEA